MTIEKILCQVDNAVVLNDDSSMYKSIVEAFKYYTLTHFEIAFGVNKLCQFISSLLICIGS